MAQAHQTRETGGEPNRIGTGWRVFQVLALLTALSWLASYVLFASPFQWLAAGEVPGWGTFVFDFSPIVSLILILMAVAPERLRFIEGDDWTAYLGRAVVFVVPALWMVNVFVGTPMVDKLITVPLDASRMIPFFGGVFLHVVFQHWFQAIGAIAFALVPDQFATLTESPTPAGIQCAVVDC